MFNNMRKYSVCSKKKKKQVIQQSVPHVLNSAKQKHTGDAWKRDQKQNKCVLFSIFNFSTMKVDF